MFHSFNTGEYLSKCLRSEKKKRMVTAEEMLGFPCNGPGRAAARVAHSLITCLLVSGIRRLVLFSSQSSDQGPINIQDEPRKKLYDCAGNGMRIPSVGFATLVAVLALQPVDAA